MWNHTEQGSKSPTTWPRIDVVEGRVLPYQDMREWADVSGAGSVADLASWFGLWFRDVDEVCDRVRQMDVELRDLRSGEVSAVSLRAWASVSELHYLLSTLRHQANLELDPAHVHASER